MKPTLSPSPWLKWNWLKLALIWNWPTSFSSKLTLIWNQPQIETGSKLKLAISRSERPLKRRGGMQKVRSNQPRERISKNWFRSASPASSAEYCSEEARKLQNYPPSILSNYIHAIYGMLYDIYFRYFWIRKFFQKNAPYNVCYCSFIEECPLLRVSNRKLRNKGNALAK